MPAALGKLKVWFVTDQALFRVATKNIKDVKTGKHVPHNTNSISKTS